jgi:hypothetical protein
MTEFRQTRTQHEIELTRTQHALGFPDCNNTAAHEHRLILSNFSVGPDADEIEEATP